MASRYWTTRYRLAIVMGVAKADVLDRIAADLARGYTAPVIQRLSSLVNAHPTDLDLRRRLAAVHRMVGNPIEAGRWGYLLLDAPAGEAHAFQRADPPPAGCSRGRGRISHRGTPMRRSGGCAGTSPPSRTSWRSGGSSRRSTGRPATTWRPAGGASSRRRCGRSS